MKVIPLLMLGGSVLAAGTLAGAQAVTSTVQLTQQSMQSANSASEQKSVHIGPGALQQGSASSQGTVQSFMDNTRSHPDCHCAHQPFFSLDSSDVAPGTEIEIGSPDPDAVIYYTTDGWTPTDASTRYSGPVTVNANTRLQAVAILPQKLPSPVAEADYMVNGAPSSPSDLRVNSGVLAKGTVLHLITASNVSSDTANVGERIAILLDQNIVVGGTTVAERGMSVDASVIWVERAGQGGKPGMIIFKVSSCTIRGTTVPLSGVLTLAATDVGTQTRRISNPSMVQVSGPLPPGTAARIQPGMPLTASVAADTPIHP